jgi:GT2 family glycosyltransferase
MIYLNIRVVMIDNGSTDGTPRAVAERYPQVEQIVNSSNRGFAAAVNQGITHALAQGAEFLFLVNNDTVLDPDVLSQFMRYTSDDSVGMLVPKIYYHDRPKVIWSVGAGMSPWTLEATGEARGQPDVGQWEMVMERECVTACAMLVPRRTFEHVGQFDERFYFYYEDMDFSLRTREVGRRILMVPRAHVWHKAAVSSGGSDSPNERYWMARSSVLYFRKHVHGWRWLIVFPYRLGSALKTTARLLAKGRPDSARAYWSGLWDGLTKHRVER